MKKREKEQKGEEKNSSAINQMATPNHS